MQTQDIVRPLSKVLRFSPSSSAKWGVSYQREPFSLDTLLPWKKEEEREEHSRHKPICMTCPSSARRGSLAGPWPPAPPGTSPSPIKETAALWFTH